MTNNTPTPLRLLALATSGAVNNPLHPYNPDYHIDPRDLPCDILRLLDEAFTLGDAISFEHGGIWTEERHVALVEKMEDVERKISAELDTSLLNVANTLFRWQTDAVIRFVIFCNKDNGNV